MKTHWPPSSSYLLHILCTICCSFTFRYNWLNMDYFSLRRWLLGVFQFIQIVLCTFGTKAPYQDLSHCHHISKSILTFEHKSACHLHDVCVKDHLLLCSRIHLEVVQPSVNKESYGNQTSVMILVSIIMCLLPKASDTVLHYHLCCIVWMKTKC